MLIHSLKYLNSFIIFFYVSSFYMVCKIVRFFLFVYCLLCARLLNRKFKITSLNWGWRQVFRYFSHPTCVVGFSSFFFVFKTFADDFTTWYQTNFLGMGEKSNELISLNYTYWDNTNSNCLAGCNCFFCCYCNCCFFRSGSFILNI